MLLLGVSQYDCFAQGGRAEAIYFTMWSMCDSQNVLVARGGPGGANLFHVLFLGVSQYDIAWPGGAGRKQSIS